MILNPSYIETKIYSITNNLSAIVKVKIETTNTPYDWKATLHINGNIYTFRLLLFIIAETVNTKISDLNILNIVFYIF